MRVLICTNVYPPRFVGGAELVAHDQAKALAALGHDVRVFAADLNGPTGRHERVEDLFEGIRVTRIGADPVDYSPEYLNFLHPQVDGHFQDLLETFRPDVVHCHNLIGLSVKLPILAKEFGAATLCTLHDLWGYCLNNTGIRTDGVPCDDITRCHECLRRVHDGARMNIPLRLRKDFMSLALDHVDAFIAPSRFIADRYLRAGIGEDRMHVLPNGIDLEQFKPRPRDPSQKTRIAFVGHFGAHKGGKTLLAAMAQLKGRDAAILSLIGQGPDEPKFRAMVDTLGIAPNVRFVGRIPHDAMKEVYAETDILVLPSLWDENQPVSIMEAMACGVTVVASRKGGIPELIESGVNGLLFPAGDDKALAEALDRLIASPELCRTMGLHSQPRLAKMGLSDQATKQADIYREVRDAPMPLDQRRRVTCIIGHFASGMTAADLAKLRKRTGGKRYYIPVDWMTDRMITDSTEIALLVGRAYRVTRFLLGAFMPVVRRPQWLSPGRAQALQRFVTLHFPPFKSRRA